MADQPCAHDGNRNSRQQSVVAAACRAILAAALILGIAALYFHIRSGQEKDGAPSSFQNPLDLKFVLGLGALISAVVVVAKIAATRTVSPVCSRLPLFPVLPTSIR